MISNLTSDEELEPAPHPVVFWYNGICFYREYWHCGGNNFDYFDDDSCYPVYDNCHGEMAAADTAIIGDSFYISENSKEKRIRMGYFSSDDGKFIAKMWHKGLFGSSEREYGSIRTRFTEKAALRLMELSDDSGAPISEIYARLRTQDVYMSGKGVAQVDLNRSYKAVKERLASIPPALTCAPDDGFPPPSFPYTGNVIFIGNGWKMRHLLGHSNVAFS